MSGLAPFGSTAFGSEPTDAGPPAVELDLIDNLNATGAFVPEALANLVESLTASGTFAPDVLANLIDRLTGADGIHAAATLAANASDGVTFFDTVMSAWNLLLAENIAVAGDAAGNIRKLAALVDALAATGQATGNLSAFAACTSAIALEGLLAQGFNADAVEQVLLTDTATAVAKLLGPLLDGVMASDIADATLRISAVASEALELGDDPGALLRANSDLADGVLLYATLRLGGTDYVGWAMNTDLRAATEYRQYPFDSFATFNNRHYAAGPNGLVRLEGDTDDGKPIAAFLRTALLDFGTGKHKRLPDCYVGIAASGAMVMKVITLDDDGNKVEDWYAVERIKANGPGTGIVKVGRGLKSTWWQFELHNVAGADFALEDISLRPLILDRRI